MSRLGELLITETLITREQLTEALTYQKANGGRLGSCLVKLNFVSEESLTACLSRQYGVASINLTYYEPDPEMTKLIPREIAPNRKEILLPTKKSGRQATRVKIAIVHNPITIWVV